jgi:hypothetical protein
MSLLDKIRKESEAPTVVIDKREDPLLDEFHIDQKDLSSKELNQSESLESQLLEELKKIPSVSQKKIGVRLEEDVLAEIQALCRDKDITVETLLEAFDEIGRTREPIMKQVIKEAQMRIKRRTRAGNIRSTLTKFRNIQKHY